MKRHKFYSYGFTLIEIIIVLVLLGILAATAVPKYFDLQAEAQKKAFLSTVAEAQGRINTRFGQLLMEGNSCKKAVEAVSTLTAIEDAEGGIFGEHVLKIEGDSISSRGTAVQAKRTEDAEFIDTGAKLYVAACSEEESILQGYLNGKLKDLIKYLMQNGHNDVKDLDWFKENYTKPITLENGTTVELTDVEGYKTGDIRTKLRLQFIDLSGNKVEIQFTTKKDGATTIHQLYLTPVDTGKKVQIIHSSTVTAQKKDAQQYESIMKNMGIDTSKFGTAFTDPKAGEITIQ